jgi:exopolyphosphatase/guanosine-5'-triphosphate,3'-diphosphate pyrophosphatase
MQKIAAIDTGSNALRLVVGTLDDNWRVEPVEYVRTPIRLGEDVFTNGTHAILRETTIQQAVDAFIQFRRIIDDFGVSRLRAVGTCAVREAQNSEILIDRIAQTSGINLEVINGDEEARLVHMAVASAMELGEKRAVLVDIGGGSVELTVTKGANIISTNSLNLGTVRLLQQLNGKNGSGSTQTFAKLLHKLTESARRRIEQEIGGEKIDICVATGGNVEEIGKLRQRIFKRDDDRSVTLEELDKLIDQLERMSVRERIRRLDMRPDRADVILPASLVLKLVADICGVKEILIPNVGLKNGILIDMARSMAQEKQLPDRAQVWESAMRIGRKYQFDLEHGSLISKLAGRLFDQSMRLHLMDGEERLILEIGALLHDVGHFINTVDHDQHGYYILKANHVIGLSERQQEMVAGLVQFHRKGLPYRDEAISPKLSQKDRLTVTKLCAFLRLADALDTSHTQRVTDAILSQSISGWRLRLVGQDDLSLEKWSVMKRRILFQDIFGVSLDVDE